MQTILAQLMAFIESAGSNLSVCELSVETQALAQRSQVLIQGKVDELRYSVPPDEASGGSTPMVCTLRRLPPLADNNALASFAFV